MSAEGTSPARSLEFILRELFTAALGVLGIYISTKIMKRVLDPNAEARERMRGRRDAILVRLRRAGVPGAALASLSTAEESLLYEMVFPEDITSSFHHIGGLGNVKESIKEIIVYPMMYPEVFNTASTEDASSSSLLAPPKGVLLYGPPGTGKTMLAKALAKESGAIFLALSPSSLLSKWLGETEQFARAVFTLARRVQPTIIFIDEIDGLFRERSNTEHEAHKNLKSEFMQLWDGLTTDDRSNQVVVLGCTNRPWDLDPAILRRMPRAFEVALPTRQERVAILETILKDVQLNEPFSFEEIAAFTEGYSGSDLKELCRAAMMQPVREVLRGAAGGRLSLPQSQQVSLDGSDQRRKQLRPLTVKDVMAARGELTRTEDQSAEYCRRTLRAANADSSAELQTFLQLLQAASNAGAPRPNHN